MGTQGYIKTHFKVEMYFFTYKIEIYWQVVILLILDFLALAHELNHIFFCFPHLQPCIGFQNRYYRMEYVPSQMGHHCLRWLLQNYLKIPACFSRILPYAIVSCTPDLHSSSNIQPGLKILFDGYFNNNYGSCQTVLILLKNKQKINLPS